MMRGYGYGYGPMTDGSSAFGGFYICLLGLLIVIALVLLVVWIVRESSHRAHPMGSGGPMAHPVPPAGPPMASAAPPMGAGPAHDEALAIARKRLAAGEINVKQFEEIRKTLES